MATITDPKTKIEYRGIHIISGKGSVVHLYTIPACFERPTPEAYAAHERIQRLIETIDPADRELVGKYHGNLVFYTMHGIEHDLDPEIVDALKERAKAHALKQSPNCRFDDVWIHRNGVDTGISVRVFL